MKLVTQVLDVGYLGVTAGTLPILGKLGSGFEADEIPADPGFAERTHPRYDERPGRVPCLNTLPGLIEIRTDQFVGPYFEKMPPRPLRPYSDDALCAAFLSILFSRLLPIGEISGSL